MSRQAHLPPRSPSDKRGKPFHSLGSPSQITEKGGDLNARHRRFPSQDSLLEGQFSWFDDLLTDSEASPVGTSLRRSVSDPIAILKASLTSHDGEERSEIDRGFEASCVYGPNSPRQKSNVIHSESSVVSALLENVSRDRSVHFADDISTGSEIACSDITSNVSCDYFPRRASRRHSRQRSRARKLQYIAELERTVDAYEAIQADLAASVASLFQQHATLSVENKQLKRQIVSIQQEQMIKQCQHHCLKNEAERLEMLEARLQESKRASYFMVGPPGTSHSGANWQMLDLGKLSLHGDPLLP